MPVRSVPPPTGLRSGLPESLAALWMAPLAAGSLLLYRLVRILTRWRRAAHARRRPDRARSWRVLGTELLDDRLDVLEMATVGPRWNPHATIGVAGPFFVRDHIAVELDTLRRSAPEWTLVIYGFPRYRTVAAVASDRDQGRSHARIELPPGRYALGLRYYRPNEGAELPTIQIDGGLDPRTDQPARIERRSVPDDVAELYRRLAGSSGPLRLLLRALAYHVLVLLRFRHRLPRRLVERVLLPVGNPETRFEYGLLGPEERLDLPGDLAPPGESGPVDPYLTVYGADSLPRHWCRIPPGGHRTPPLGEPGFFVLRIHPRSEDPEPTRRRPR